MCLEGCDGEWWNKLMTRESFFFFLKRKVDLVMNWLQAVIVNNDPRVNNSINQVGFLIRRQRQPRLRLRFRRPPPARSPRPSDPCRVTCLGGEGNRKWHRELSIFKYTNIYTQETAQNNGIDRDHSEKKIASLVRWRDMSRSRKQESPTFQNHINRRSLRSSVVQIPRRKTHIYLEKWNGDGIIRKHHKL